MAHFELVITDRVGLGTTPLSDHVREHATEESARAELDRLLENGLDLRGRRAILYGPGCGDGRVIDGTRTDEG